MKRTLHVGEEIIFLNETQKAVITMLPNGENEFSYDTADENDVMEICEIMLNGKPYNVYVDSCYSINKELSEKYGYTICNEHISELADYPYYIPHRDENAFEIELETMKP